MERKVRRRKRRWRKRNEFILLHCRW